jgi:hypothetical protein
VKDWLLANIALPREGLALFRRCLALLVLFDGLQRLSEAALLYSDRGVLPRYAYFSYLETTYSWSLYLLSGEPALAIVLLLLTVGLACWQLWGRDRRWSRVLLWMLVWSVQSRHPGLTDAADDLLRLLLFWNIFLPEKRQQQGKERGDLVSLGTLGLQWQLSLTLLGTCLQVTPERWALAAQWGQSEAIGAYWLGRVPLAALVALWLRPGRQLLLALSALALVVQAEVMHPIFPMTLTAGLSCLWCSTSGSGPLVLGDSLREPSRYKGRWLAWVLLCGLAALAALRGPAAPATLDLLGWRQDWGRVYPLSRASRGELVLRASGSREPLYTLDLQQGRRLRLLTDALLRDARLLPALVVCQAVRAGVEGPVEVWLKLERLTPQGDTPSPEVRQLGTVVVRAGRAVVEGAP